MKLLQMQTETLAQRLGQAPVISTEVDDYKPFLAITQDANPIHTDEDYAKKTMFNGLVVPGLYLALAAEGFIPKGTAAMDMVFNKAVRPGDDIRFLEHDSNIEKKIVWYNASGQEPEVVLEARIRLNSPEQNKRIDGSEEGVKKYEWKARKGDIESMMSMAGMIGEPDNALNMHAAGYISPALLMFAQEGVTGAYKRQNFTFHSRLYADEKFKVLARIARRKQQLVSFEYNLIGSDGRIVVAGNALVVETRHEGGHNC